jgi:hypothetical protein
MQPQPLIRLDTTNLMKAQRLLNYFSKTSPAESLNKTGAFVVHTAKDMTPVTSMARIDAELQVDSVPVLYVRGPKKGTKKPGKKLHYNVTEGGLATKVVLARLNRYSNYNVLTDMKYAIDRASFSPGEGASGFWGKVEETAQKMVGRRHSSTEFFKVSWNPILKMLASFVPSNYRGAVLTWAGEGREAPEDISRVYPARIGSYTTQCKIQNRLGFDEHYPTIAAIRNMEANRILYPILNIAIQREFAGKMRVFFKKDLQQQRAALYACGMVLLP